MNRFQRCLADVLRHEGGYVDHPNDPGGATNFGITRKTLAKWRGVKPWWKLAKSEVRSLRQAEVSAIYKANYWHRCRAAFLPKGLDYALFDFAVNSGPDRAIRFIQAILKVSMDGIIGPITLQAIRNNVARNGSRALIIELCKNRLAFLTRLSNFKTFGKGWRRRVAAVQRTSLAAAGSENQTTNQTNSETVNQRTNPMNFLPGYKTYIVAIAMLIAGIGQMLGVDLPGFAGQASGQLVFEAFAILFLRRGLKNEIANT